MNWRWSLVIILAMAGLSACATVPTGPSVMVFPGEWKPFEVFQFDDAVCRQWAAEQSGISPSDAFNQTLAAGAGIGTLLGAGLGVAIGAAYGNPGAGAAIGAASGLLGGTAMSTDPAYAAGYGVQRRYDNAYVQCMYAKGNQIPGHNRHSGQAASPPPPPGFTPEPSVPPSPGTYPPPPPP